MPEPIDGGRDSSTPIDGSDECEGLTLCTTAGTTCDDDSVVTCAANADGCLVETRDDCGADGDVCTVTEGTATCTDPCLAIPAEMRCEAEGRSCDGDSLEICAANADGCFVLEATNCAEMPDGVCGMGESMLECLLPEDPCAAIPAAERCTVEGTSCMDDSLVACAPNAFGCLVTTTTDCTTRTGGTCDDTTDPADATCVATDACVGLELCTTAGSVCDGPVLVTCGEDAFGCLVETAEDCTEATFGFCDADATPSDICSTAAVDPCMGVTECGAAPARTCSDASTLSVCAANAFGCFVTETTNCATDGDVCDTTGEMPMCVDPCSLIDTCAAAGTSCDGDEVVTCAANPIGCIVETARTACDVGESCAVAGGAAMCVLEANSTCATARAVTGNAIFSAQAITTGGPRPQGTVCGTHTGNNALYYSVTIPPLTRVDVTTSGSLDRILMVQDACGAPDCSFRTDTAPERATLLNDTAAPVVEIVAISNWSSSGTANFDITFGYIPYACGNGVREGVETCDDGNAAAADGCSMTCQIESGYVCAGQPSACTLLAPNGMCSGATAFAGTTVLTGQRLLAGGPPPSATGCGPSAGPVRYYAVSVPARSRVEVYAQSTGTSWDLTLRTLDACGGACTAHVDDWDTLEEELEFENLTATPRTVYVAVGSLSATVFDTYDIEIVTTNYICGNGTLNPSEACDDGNTAAGDGCSATCVIESGFGCRATSPSVCWALAPNATCAGAIPMGTSIMGTLTTGGGTRPTGTNCGASVGPVVYYTVDVPANSFVTVTADPSTAWDPTVRVLADCGGTCTVHQDAAGSSADEVVRVYNPTGATVTRRIAVGADSASTFGDFTLTASAPTALAANATCAGGRAITTDVSFTGEAFAAAGPRPQGTGCGTSSGDSALYYTVTVPPLTVVAVTTTGTPDRVLLVKESCAATSCTFRTDSSPERADIVNGGATPITRVVAVHGYSASTTGVFDIAFAYSPVPYATAAISAACVDASAGTVLHAPAVDDAISATATLPFAFSYFGDAITHYRVSSNGYVQLSTSTTMAGGESRFNASIPTTSDPDGLVAAFWDDLVVNAAGSVRTITTGAAGSQRFVVEWNDMSAFDDDGDSSMRIQAHLIEGTNVVELHYCSMTNAGTSLHHTGDSASIGLESVSGSAGVQISVDSAGAVMTGSGVRLTPNP